MDCSPEYVENHFDVVSPVTQCHGFDKGGLFNHENTDLKPKVASRVDKKCVDQLKSQCRFSFGRYGSMHDLTTIQSRTKEES